MSRFGKWAQKTGFVSRTKSAAAPLPEQAAPQTAQAPAQSAVTLFTADGQAVTLSAVHPHPTPPGQTRMVGVQRPAHIVHPQQVLPRRSSTRHAPECMIVKPDDHAAYTNLLHQLPDMVETGQVPNLNPDGVNMLTAFGAPDKAVMQDWTPNARAYNGTTERSTNVEGQMHQRNKESLAAARSGGSHAVTDSARGETFRKIS